MMIRVMSQWIPSCGLLLTALLLSPNVPAASPDGPPTEVALVTSIVNGSPQNNFDGYVGMKVTVGSYPINVTQLGRFMAEGNAGTHTVKLVNAADGTDMPGGAVSISMRDGIVGQFKYANLANAVTLVAGNTYYILSEENAGGDSWSDIKTKVTTTSVATARAAIYSTGLGYLDGPSSRAYGPVDFKYNAGVFVATDGLPSNRGTIDSPWPLDYALWHAGASNTITVLPGEYPSIDLVDPVAMSGLTLRSQPKWGAKVIGSAGMHGISTQPGVSNVVIDGFEVSHAYIDGVKFNADHSTVRNCWIHHSGTTGGSSGQGVAAHNQAGTIIEYNLIEYNGVWNRHDHGVYINGTNDIVRGNVIRYNWAYGVQIYDADPQGAADCQVCNNLIYNNGQCGADDGVVIYSTAGRTNYVLNNTIISTKAYAITCQSGVLAVSNNIIVGNRGGFGWYQSLPTVFLSDYNLSCSPLSVAGSHDLVTTDPGFVNPGSGLFWLQIGSPARAVANTTVLLAFDAFGRAKPTTVDIGAFQYNPALTIDSRILDPSPSQGADYWVKP